MEEARLAHIGRTNEVMRGYVEGTAVDALCGARLVPSRDPDRMPDCEDCTRLFELMRAVRAWRSELDPDELLAVTCDCGGLLLPGLDHCFGCERPVDGP